MPWPLGLNAKPSLRSNNSPQNYTMNNSVLTPAGLRLIVGVLDHVRNRGEIVMVRDQIQMSWASKTAMKGTYGTDDGDLGAWSEANASREICDLAELLDASRIPIRSQSPCGQRGHCQGIVAVSRGNRLLRLRPGPRHHLGRAGRLAGWQIHRVRAFIQDNLDWTIRATDLSCVAHRSPTSFCRAFKRTSGVPPRAYVVRGRLNYPGCLMLATDTPLCKIAFICGFSDQAHLSGSFRQSTGQIPAAWRRKRRTAARPGQPPSEVSVHYQETDTALSVEWRISLALTPAQASIGGCTP
jgi:AraC-like DNA-binding protein